MRRFSLLASLLVVCASAAAAAPAAHRPAEARVRKVHASQRPAGHPARRSEAAHGQRQPVVPRRLEERADGAHRLRPSLRAHDVPGLRQREGGLLHVRRDPRREPAGGRRQRHDQPGPHELLRDGALFQPGDPPLARVGPPGDSARGDDQGEARQPAGRRQERAPPGAREHALRALVQARPREPPPRRPSLLVDRHRKPRRPDGRFARGRDRLLQDLLHAEQPLARDRRRLRSGGSQAPGREVLRRNPGRARAGPADALDPDARRARRSSRRRTGCRRTASTWRGRRRPASLRGMPSST